MSVCVCVVATELAIERNVSIIWNKVQLENIAIGLLQPVTSVTSDGSCFHYEASILPKNDKHYQSHMVLIKL